MTPETAMTLLAERAGVIPDTTLIMQHQTLTQLTRQRLVRSVTSYRSFQYVAQCLIDRSTDYAKTWSHRFVDPALHQLTQVSAGTMV